MKHFKTLLAAALILPTQVAVVSADGHRGRDSFYVNARVLEVKPIVRTVQVATPQRVCRNARVRHGGHSQHYDQSYTPVVVGSIVGGVVGNQFGEGRGKDVATVAGALLGASIGHDYARKHDGDHYVQTYHRPTERYCRTEQVYHEERRVEGYRVRYSYHGREFWTRSKHHPGARIRVQVQVEPPKHYHGGHRH